MLRSAVCTSTQRSTRPRSSFAFSTLEKKFLSSTAYLPPTHRRSSWLSSSSIHASIPLSSFTELTQSTRLRALCSVPGGRSPTPTLRLPACWFRSVAHLPLSFPNMKEGLPEYAGGLSQSLFRLPLKRACIPGGVRMLIPIFNSSFQVGNIPWRNLTTTGASSWRRYRFRRPTQFNRRA